MSMSMDPKKMQEKKDQDPQETMEWLQAFESVLQQEGPQRAQFILEKLYENALKNEVKTPDIQTPYVNTLSEDVEFFGDLEMEKRINQYLRWNAMAMVVKANQNTPQGEGDLGGHISSYASSATLLDVGFNHFWKGDEKERGDLVYFQGHAAPGVYARAFLEGRISEEQLNHFRQEVQGQGLSSYPHPHLMPSFWQFPTVSMGLGPLMGIYQARFLKYLHARGIADTSNRKVWVFCGDGEMDEVESLGALGVAHREQLDNLIFIVNCNLQRLDGPVRGNGKVVQELEGYFKGAQWNVIKVLWGSGWDALFKQDHQNVLKEALLNTVDGQFQRWNALGPKAIKEELFGQHPELQKMVEGWSMEQFQSLVVGGHDMKKVYSAFDRAQKAKAPTVILAQTVKGFGMGAAGEGKNTAHQTKKLKVEDLKHVRDRFQIPIEDHELENLQWIKPKEGSLEAQYLKQRRQSLQGAVPQRRTQCSEVWKAPQLNQWSSVLEATQEGREISTTQAFVRCLSILLKDPQWGPRVVPILVDEARTFGMEGLFRQIGIYSPKGQLYTPVDQEQVMFYKEDQKGQILQEGINEAGAMSSWIAAATSYSTVNKVMVPFYIFYSMFGLQRIGDLAWAAADMQARGFLLGGTSGRTTLNGEGLQHEDGHSQLFASTIPNCISYDPAFAHEVAVIVQDGLKRMHENQENVFYYLTLLNENTSQPGLQQGQEQEILKGMYLFKEAACNPQDVQVNLLGSGAIFQEVLAAQQLLKEDWGVHAHAWSCPSFNELARQGQDIQRKNRLNPEKEPEKAFVTQQLEKTTGPVIAATDYVKAWPEQIRAFVPKERAFHVLGTDGMGRSDYRSKLRKHFEVDRYCIAMTALYELAQEGKITHEKVKQAIEKYGIQTQTINPLKA